MPAPSNQLSLPLPLFSSSSNIESKPRPVHSSDCSLRPQKSIIRIKEDWWGSPANEIAIMSIGEERETGKGKTKRRLGSSLVLASRSQQEEGNSGKQEEQLQELSGCRNDIDLDVPSKKQSTGLRQAPPLSRTSSRPPRTQRGRRSKPSRNQRTSPPNSESHPWLPSSPFLPLLSPSALPLRSATSVLGVPLGTVQCGLRFPDYQPFLTDQSIDPQQSFCFYRIQIEFFTSISNPTYWSNKVQSSVFTRPDFYPLLAKVMGLQPDLERIRKLYPLGTSSYELGFDEKKDWIWGELGDVLDWMYGRRVRIDEILWFVEHVPQPLLAIARIHAVTLRYSRGVSSASQDFATFLRERSSSKLARHEEKRAESLMSWLRRAPGGSKGARWKNWWRDEVQRDRQGRELKGKGWLDSVRGWETVEDLEAWEEGVKAAE